MAGQKIIKKRIASVKNTRKITRTMEMVATAKSKKLVDRVHAAQPYTRKLHEIMASVVEAGGSIESPFMRTSADPRKIALIIITANRGLCGGYNSNVLKMARARYQIWTSEDREVDVYVIGKKGASYLRFVQVPMKETITTIDDTFQYEQADEISTRMMDMFESGKYDQITIASTVYHSAGRQAADFSQLLPIGIADLTGAAEQEDGKPPAKVARGPVIYDPDPSTIATKMVPLAVKTKMYTAILEAVASEQIYRRIAMKNATDAAGDMLKSLTRTYNRARQASITQELSEIVAGADAI